MLRGVLGDNGFFALLRALCDQRGSEMLTTESFRELAAGFLPADYTTVASEISSTSGSTARACPGCRQLGIKNTRGGQHHFNLRLVQSGVPEYFPVPVSVEVHTLPGRSLVKKILVGDGDDERASRWCCATRQRGL